MFVSLEKDRKTKGLTGGWRDLVSVCVCVCGPTCVCRCVCVPPSSLCLFNGPLLPLYVSHAPTQAHTHIYIHISWLCYPCEDCSVDVEHRKVLETPILLIIQNLS